MLPTPTVIFMLHMPLLSRGWTSSVGAARKLTKLMSRRASVARRRESLMAIRPFGVEGMVGRMPPKSEGASTRT